MDFLHYILYPAAVVAIGWLVYTVKLQYQEVQIQKQRISAQRDEILRIGAGKSDPGFPNPHATNEMIDRKVERAKIIAASEASRDTIIAVFRHLDIPPPTLVCLPSLRDQPITRETTDLWPYIDEEAAQRLDTLAQHAEHITSSPTIQSLLDEIDEAFDQPIEQSMVMPTTTLGKDFIRAVEELEGGTSS